MSTDDTIALPVCFSVTGHSWVFNVSPRAGIDSLRQNIFHECQLDPRDQILLSGGPPFVKVNPKKMLNALKHMTVYVFDRACISRMETEGLQIIPLQPGDIDLTNLSDDGSSISRPLIENASPLLKALETYETQFILHGKQVSELNRIANARIVSIKSSLLEQKGQLDAINVAVGNLESITVDLSRKFSDFESECLSTKGYQQDILDGFDTNLERLRDIVLHEALQTESRITLYDCCPVDGLKAWAEERKRNSFRLLSKVNEVAETIKQIQNNVEEEVTRPRSSFENMITEINEELQNLVKDCNGIKKYQERITQDTSKVAMALDNASSTGDLSGIATATHEADNAFNVHIREIIPKLKAMDNLLKCLQEKCSSAKHKSTSELYSTIRNLNILQSRMKDRGQVFIVLKQGLNQERDHFLELEHVQHMPKAYLACIAEIVRRRQYSRMFNTKIQSMAEEISELRKQEVDRREIFLRTHGVHLPADLVSLNGRPPHCDISTRSFDESLPEIDSIGGSLSLPVESKAIKTTDKPVLATEESNLHSSKEVEELQRKLNDLDISNKKLEEEVAKYEMEKKISENKISKLIREVTDLNSVCASVVESAVSAETAATNPFPIPQIPETDISKAQKLVEQIKLQLSDVRDHLRRQKEQVCGLERSVSRRISYLSFNDGDNALFVMKQSTGPNGLPVYIAYHSRKPHHYLHEDCVHKHNMEGTYPNFILAKIILVEDMIAGPSNPYGVPEGLGIHTVFVEFPSLVPE